MGQMYGNHITNINIENASNAYKKGAYAGASYVGGDKGNSAIGNVADADEILGYKYNKNGMKSKVTKSISEGFDDYMKSVQGKEKQENIDEEAKEREQKKNEREIAGNLSHEEMAKLAMMGIDIEGAKLSDIMGIVNTMRGNAHREEKQQMMAEIIMSGDASEGTVIAGGNVISAATGVELDSVEVADVISDENKADKFTRNDFVYLVKNNLEIDKDSMYKAHYSGNRINEETDVSLFEEMRPQLEKVIMQAGYEVDDNSLAGAKLLLDNELPVNTDNIRKYIEFSDIFDKSIDEISIEETSVKEKIAAEQLYDKVQVIDSFAIYEMSMKGMDITIASAYSYGRNRGEYMPVIPFENQNNKGASQKELKAISDMRAMEEIRLSMTFEAANKMIKQDINIDTRELSKVVSKLKELEQGMIADSLKKNGVEPTAENISLVNEMNQKINELAIAPAGVVAARFVGRAFTVNSLVEFKDNIGSQNLDISDAEIKSPNLSDMHEDNASIGITNEIKGSRSFETAMRSYEAAETKVRGDLGDNIQKAFSNVDDILGELELPVDYEHQRAVRILGYNSLPINESNINEIINYDRQVNTLIDSFYPEAVMGLIKDGINPMDVNIDELNQIIAERNYNQGVTEAENFATYLRDVEKQGELTPEERESYIGIYRIMEKLAKSGDREAGWVYRNGSSLTVRNLITAARSRRATGISADVDDSFGLLQELNVHGNRIDAQIERAFSKMNNQSNESTEGKPEIDTVIENVAGEAELDTVIENVARETELDTLIETSYQEDVEAISNEAVNEFMKQQQIDFTMINAKAVNVMLNQSAGIYGLVSELISKMKFTSTVKADSVDEETENMTDSMLGEEIENNISMENILESIGNETLTLKYDDIREQLTELMYSAATVGTISSRDIASVKTVMAGFNILGSMAKDDHFQIPYKTENGMSVMNLTIKHDEGNRGNINISLETKSYGRIEANVRLTAENIFEGHIVASGSEANVSLMEQRSTILASFAKAGYSAEAISLGQLSTGKNAEADFQKGNALYRAAVATARVLSEL